MKVHILALATLLFAGFQASAMPAVEGRYTCTVPQAPDQPKTLDFRVSNDKLFVDGLGDVNNPAMSEGLPCANGEESGLEGTVAFTVKASCDASSMTYKMSIKEDASSTDLNVDIGVILVDPTHVDLKIAFSGKLQGQDMTDAITINCAKN